MREHERKLQSLKCLSDHLWSLLAQAIHPILCYWVLPAKHSLHVNWSCDIYHYGSESSSQQQCLYTQKSGTKVHRMVTAPAPVGGVMQSAYRAITQLDNMNTTWPSTPKVCSILPMHLESGRLFLNYSQKKKETYRWLGFKDLASVLTFYCSDKLK